MDWTKFNNHGESSNHAFEVMCNILFKYWFKKEYKDNISHFAFIMEQALEPGYKPPYYRNAFLCNAMVNMYMIDTNSMGIPMIYEMSCLL